jgi:hypothetical protein
MGGRDICYWVAWFLCIFSRCDAIVLYVIFAVFTLTGLVLLLLAFPRCHGSRLTEVGDPCVWLLYALKVFVKMSLYKLQFL